MFTHIQFGDTCDLLYLRFFTRDSLLAHMNTPYDPSKTQQATTSENFAGSQVFTGLVRVSRKNYGLGGLGGVTLEYFHGREGVPWQDSPLSLYRIVTFYFIFRAMICTHIYTLVGVSHGGWGFGGGGYFEGSELLTNLLLTNEKHCCGT